MTSDELIAAVPVHDYKGRPFFLRLAEIPEPYLTQLFQSLVGCACPALPGEGGPLYHASDWYAWASGQWYGRGPIGLDS